MLTLIKENSSHFVASEIVHRLYMDKFLKKYFQETTMTTTIYDAIDIKQDDDSIRNSKRRHHLCSRIC